MHLSYFIFHWCLPETFWGEWVFFFFNIKINVFLFWNLEVKPLWAKDCSFADGTWRVSSKKWPNNQVRIETVFSQSLFINISIKLAMHTLCQLRSKVTLILFSRGVPKEWDMWHLKSWVLVMTWRSRVEGVGGRIKREGMY